MILRRVFGDSRSREWRSAIVDLVIVVVGIFLGLQANNWNEQRKQRAEGEFYLQLLREELLEESALHEELIERYTETNDKITESARLLYADEWTDEQYSKFSTEHWRVYHVLTGIEKPDVLRQLTDLGKVDLIESKELQRALFSYSDAFDWAIGQDSEAARAIGKAQQDIVTLLPYGSSDDLMSLPESPAEVLEQAELAPAFRVIAIMNSVQIESLIYLHQEREQFLTEIDTYLYGT